MTGMTQVQRDAMRMAQNGDWRLANAMELEYRFANERRRGDLTLHSGLLDSAAGRMRWLLYAATADCDDCEGLGTVECGCCGIESSCGTCDGFGEIGHDSPDNEIVDLNGDRAPEEIRILHQLQRSDAERHMNDYKAGRLLEGAANEQKELAQCA